MAKLVLKSSNTGKLLTGRYVIQSLVIGVIGGFFYGLISDNFFDIGNSFAFKLGCYICAGVWVTLFTNQFFIKSSFIFYLIYAFCCPFCITWFFLSVSFSFSLDIFNTYTASSFLCFLLVYGYIEYMEAKHMPLISYITLLINDKKLLLSEDGNYLFESKEAGFYGYKYFKGAKYPLSKYKKIFDGLLLTVGAIATPFAQSEFYLKKAGETDNMPYIMIFIGLFIGLGFRWHFVNLAMIYRLDKALKRGDITPEDIFKSNS